MSERYDPLPPDITALLDHERRASGLDCAARGRLMMRLAALGPTLTRTDGGARADDGGASGPPPGARGVGASLAAKLGIVVLAVGVGAVSGAAVQARYATVRDREVTRGVVVVNASEPSGTTAASASSPVARAAVPALGAAPPVAPAMSFTSAAATPSGAGRDGRLGRERASLEVARTAITRGDFDPAASAIARHSREFPDGQLAEEREAMRVQVLVGQRRFDEARAAATRFREQFPRSLLQQSVNSAIAAVQ